MNFPNSSWPTSGDSPAADSGVRAPMPARQSSQACSEREYFFLRLSLQVGAGFYDAHRFTRHVTRVRRRRPHVRLCAAAEWGVPRVPECVG